MILNALQAASALKRSAAYLTPADAKQLHAIAALLDETTRQVQVQAACDAAFAGTKVVDVVDNLGKLIKRLNNASEEHGFNLRIEQLGARKLGAERRMLQFEGDASLSDVGGFELSDPASQPGAVVLEVRARLQVPKIALTKQADGKSLVRMFFSYAHDDGKYPEEFIKLLKLRLNVSKNYRYEIYKDNEQLLPGVHWRDNIQHALENCDIGLLAVSYAFLNSSFITKEELPSFVSAEPGRISPQKRAIPLLFEGLSFTSCDLKGLQEQQFFKDSKARPYMGLPLNDRKAWVDALFDRIEQLLDKYAISLFVSHSAFVTDTAHATSSVVESTSKAAGSDSPSACPIPNEQGTSDFDKANKLGFIPDVQGRPSTLHKDSRFAQQTESEPNSTNSLVAFDALYAWATQPSDKPCFALLGEYGTGKTVTCQRLVQALLKDRAEGKTAPQPLYFDLREVTGLRTAVGQLRTLDEVIAECVTRTWRAQPGSPKPSVQDVHDAIDAGALVIWDGLDECLVHLGEADGMAFTRMLLSVLPAHLKTLPEGAPRKKARVLISCRNEFFRNVRDEQTQLTGADRSDKDANAFEVLQLLPLTEAQVRSYLSGSIAALKDPAELERFMALIASVHNLPELTRRPYTLRLVGELLPRIDALVKAGKKVYSVTLYREMMLSLIERDAGKHYLSKDHKLQLAADLAAKLWQGGSRTLDAKALDDWFEDWFHGHPRIKRRYENENFEKLLEELRNSSFLVRHDDQDTLDSSLKTLGFRFGHSSQLEYFLACHLFDALVKGEIDAWKMELPSRETFRFLSQLMQQAQHEVPAELEAAMASLGRLRDSHAEQASVCALAYALGALEDDHPAQSLSGLQMPGEFLGNCDFIGAMDKPLNMAGANFKVANLSGLSAAKDSFDVQGVDYQELPCQFESVDLSFADFSGAICDGIEFNQGEAKGSNWGNASLDGAVFRDINLEHANFQGASLAGATFIRCQFLALGEGDLISRGALVYPEETSSLIVAPQHLAVTSERFLTFNEVSIAWSPNGGELASSGLDGTVYVWKLRDPESVRRCVGANFHPSRISWKPDGEVLAAIGLVGDVNLWDLKTNEQRLLSGCIDLVVGEAWSTQSVLLAVSDGDGYVGIWDRDTGSKLTGLTGHDARVLCVAWSPDGATVASGGADFTVRLWDSGTGLGFYCLTGHRDRIECVSWRPDGAVLASAGQDNTIRLWQIATGKELSCLPAQSGGVRALAWRADGALLASGGCDGSVRVWDAASGAELHNFVNDTGAVTCVAWHPDGSLIASAGDDHIVRLWDVSSGACLRENIVLSGDELAVCSNYLGEVTDHRVLGRCERGILAATQGAWRYLSWEGDDPVTGERQVLPAEAFGRLPELTML